MQYVARLNEQLLKYNELKHRDLYHWIVFKHIRSQQSSAFTTVEYLEYVQSLGQYKTLNNLPGNYKSKKRNKLEQLFKDSILFTKDIAGRYVAISERKLCKHNGKKARYIYLTDADLSSPQAFKQAIMLATRKKAGQISHKRAAKVCGCSPATAYRRTKKLLNDCRLNKMHNLVVLNEFDDMESARLFQDTLYQQSKKRLHIKIIKMNSKYYLCGFLANSYFVDTQQTTDETCLEQLGIHKSQRDKIIDNVIERSRRMYLLCLKAKDFNLFKPSFKIDYCINDYLILHTSLC